jgi:DUF1680 family protein
MMAVSRRKFIEGSACALAWAATSPLLNAESLPINSDNRLFDGDLTGERVAHTAATWYRPYRSRVTTDAASTTWVQVDLQYVRPIDEVKLLPNHDGFPVRFKIEASDDATFASSHLVADRTDADYPDPSPPASEYNPTPQVLAFKANGVSGRYVRFTATHLRPFWQAGTFGLALRKMEVIYEWTDIAERCPVTADEKLGNPSDLEQLTRSPRPMGEYVVTDHPGNVTAASSWKRVPYRLNAPLGGVSLKGGVFEHAMDNNVRYLLEWYTVDDLLSEFRMRAVKPDPSPLKYSTSGWINDLAGSNAGRFLMGAGNALRWIDNPELRKRLNAVVDGIEDCRQSDDYIMAYPEDTIFVSERGGYTRAWLTHGLIEAGYAGNPKAFQLLRGYYDWFDACSYLPELMRRANQGVQGMIANTRMYFTPVGKPEDIQVIQRYFQENYWLEGLAEGDEAMVWQYPYDRPHCYLLTDCNAYLDLYRATGEERYLNAVLGAWQLFYDKWLMLGGSTAIIEEEEDPPLSYRLLGVPLTDTGGARVHGGELCGSVFWTFLNQRLHFLFPDREVYVAEIEKSIYNVALANQVDYHGIIYHALLLGKKEEGTHHNTCCEGQGTRLFGSLPEHIYSLAGDGISVNLFEASTIEWKQAGQSIRCTMSTKFPFNPEVKVAISTATPIRSRMRIRVPSWVSEVMPIAVNGKVKVNGAPGSFEVLDRIWTDGDAISFTLPMRLKITKYEGVDQIPGKQRYGFEYGPILLAAVGSDDIILRVVDGSSDEDLLKQIKPNSVNPLHFIVDDNQQVEFMPYWQVTDQTFTCFPAVEMSQKSTRWNSD